MHNLDHYKDEFGKIGWFIPPYVSIGFLDVVLLTIRTNTTFSDQQLQNLLALVYSAEHLASMVIDRYPKTKFISEYKEIISESVQAHFLGLHHIAVAGIMPVIEGACKNIARDRNISVSRSSTKKIFLYLAKDCIEQAKKYQMGMVGEVISMLNSFSEYAESNLYIDSEKYPHADNTNRHGILHGSYADEDYGIPLNFYKAIASIDFLCFICSFKHGGSWMAPDPSEQADKLKDFYLACSVVAKLRPKV